MIELLVSYSIRVKEQHVVKWKFSLSDLAMKYYEVLKSYHFRGRYAISATENHINKCINAINSNI